jgi:hypothetical protein
MARNPTLIVVIALTLGCTIQRSVLAEAVGDNEAAWATHNYTETSNENESAYGQVHYTGDPNWVMLYQYHGGTIYLSPGGRIFGNQNFPGDSEPDYYYFTVSADFYFQVVALNRIGWPTSSARAEIFQANSLPQGRLPEKPAKTAPISAGNPAPLTGHPADAGGAYFSSSTAYLTITGALGNSDYIWLTNPPRASTSSPLPWNPTYFFQGDNKFTHFKIPSALAGGDDEFSVVFGGVSHSIHANQTFAFTDFVPGGVQSFFLTGLDGDQSLVSGQPFPYEYALRVANEGSLKLNHGPLQPGDFTMGGAVDQNDYLLWRSSFGSTTDLPIDGNNNGVVDAADYVVWRKALAYSASGLGIADVPEPPTWLLFSLALSCVATRPAARDFRRTSLEFGRLAGAVRRDR